MRFGNVSYYHVYITLTNGRTAYCATLEGETAPEGAKHLDTVFATSKRQAISEAVARNRRWMKEKT
jgi:hypothetical protein